jgi:peroxiredoxin Q/BCP
MIRAGVNEALLYHQPEGGTMTILQPGDLAPPFELSDQDGNTVRLADFSGRYLFIFFYPKANTSG